MKVLKFEATWCAPCKMLKEVISNIETDVVIESIDIDTNSDLAAQYNIRSVPTCIIVDDEGNEVSRHIGMMNKDTFNEFIKIGRAHV